MSRLLDDDQDDLPERERELTLSTGAILAIFLGLVLLCAIFFGFGYNLGRKSTTVSNGCLNDHVTSAGTCDDEHTSEHINERCRSAHRSCTCSHEPGCRSAAGSSACIEPIYLNPCCCSATSACDCSGWCLRRADRRDLRITQGRCRSAVQCAARQRLYSLRAHRPAGQVDPRSGRSLRYESGCGGDAGTAGRRWL